MQLLSPGKLYMVFRETLEQFMTSWPWLMTCEMLDGGHAVTLAVWGDCQHPWESTRFAIAPAVNYGGAGPQGEENELRIDFPKRNLRMKR